MRLVNWFDTGEGRRKISWSEEERRERRGWLQPGGKGESNCQLTDCTGGCCCIWRTKAQLAHCYAALPSYLREPLNCAARSSLPVESFRAKCLLRRAAKHVPAVLAVPVFVCFLLRALPSYRHPIRLSSIVIIIYMYIRAFAFVSFVLSGCRAFLSRSVADRSVTGYRLSGISW